MALDLTILNSHMARVFTDFPLTVYWQGRGIAAVRSTATMSQLMEVGGAEETIEFDLFLRSSDLPRIPKEGDVFVVDKVKMGVKTVRRASETGELIACGMRYLRTGDYP